MHACKFKGMPQGLFLKKKQKKQVQTVVYAYGQRVAVGLPISGWWEMGGVRTQMKNAT